MSQLINGFYYFSIFFILIFSFWTFKTFIDTRRRYKTTRMLKGTDKDLESIRQLMKRPNKSIVLEGDTSAKSMQMLGKTFDQIKNGMISNSLKNDDIKTVNNSNNNKEPAKENDIQNKT